MRRVVGHFAVHVLGREATVDPVYKILACFLLSFVLMLYKVISCILLVDIARALVVLARVLVIRRYIQTASQLGVGALQQVLICHGGRFLSGLLMPRHEIPIAPILILRGALTSFCPAFCEVRRWLSSLALLWGVLRLSLRVGVLVHDEHIIAVTNAMLICNFARLCSSGGVLLIENILKLSHPLSLLDSKLLALLVPAPLVDLCLCEQSLLGYHEQGLLGPVGVLLKLSQQLVKLVSCFSLPFSDKSFHLACLIVENVASSLLIEAWVH